jgi:hypothetical protein
VVGLTVWVAPAPIATPANVAHEKTEPVGPVAVSVADEPLQMVWSAPAFTTTIAPAVVLMV